ncbi:MAG TPA: hypothetical protein VMZ22_00150 [Acidimicrobiales bacterium]|nr:hypothetical protein [Acidimicrobiales bacterium]
MKRVKLTVGDVVFASLALAAIVIRGRALADLGVPPGFDGGDWLALGRGLFGEQVRPSGLAASPVTPVLTYASVMLAGARFTFVAFAAVFAVAPGAGVYAVLRNRIASVDAALVAALVVACAASGEAASWGGYPQLLSLGLLPPALVLVDRAFDRGDAKLTVVAGVALLGLVLTSDFVFTLAALATTAIVAARLSALVALKGWRVVRRLLLLLALPLVVSIPLAAQIAKARVAAVLNPAGTTAVSQSFIERVNFVVADRRLLWHIVLLAGVAAIVLLWERRFETHWRVGAVVAVVGLALTTLFDEPRLAYLLPTAGALSLGLWSPELRRLSRLPLFAFAVGLGCLVQFETLPATARLQARSYQALTPEMVEAIDWLDARSDSSSLVAVTPYNDGPAIGWWIEGLAGVRTLTASNLRWLHFDTERATAKQAAQIFASGVPDVARLRRAKAMDVTLVFVDKRWGSFDATRVRALRTEAPRAVAFENDDVVILATAGLGE